MDKRTHKMVSNMNDVEVAEWALHQMEELMRNAVIARVGMIAVREDGDEMGYIEPEDQSPLYTKAHVLLNKLTSMFLDTDNTTSFFAIRKELALIQSEVHKQYFPKSDG